MKSSTIQHVSMLSTHKTASLMLSTRSPLSFVFSLFGPPPAFPPCPQPPTPKLYQQHHTARVQASEAAQRPMHVRGMSAGDVRVHVPANERLGVELDPGYRNNAAVVTRHYPIIDEQDGRSQPGFIKKHGGVFVGDVLVRIDDDDVSTLQFQDVIDMLTSRAGNDRVLFFRNERDHYGMLRKS